MIVRPAGSSVLLITQPDHAALSRRMMERCPSLGEHPRRSSVLHAIGEHDNGWREPDAAPAIDPATGRIADFINAPAAVRQAVWPRGVSRLAPDPWAAALVAQHAIVIYGRFRTDAGWEAFFESITAERDRLLDTVGGSRADLEQDYTFVRLGDLLSLTFCTGWTEPQHLEGITVVHRHGQVTATPDPFGGQRFAIEVAARELAATPFASDAELRAALQAAPGRTLRGEVVSA